MFANNERLKDAKRQTTRAEAKASARIYWQFECQNIWQMKGKFMKTRHATRICNFRLKLPVYGGSYFTKKALKLERALARKPKVLHLEMIGEGEIPADTALLIRSILMKRLPETQLVTNARSSLQGGSVLVWLLGRQTHYSR